MTAAGILPSMEIASAVNENEVMREIYGKLSDGREVGIFTLTNRHGLRARVAEYGAILVSMEAPDRDGHLADLTHGYDELEGWVEDRSFLGATVGRFGNRIAAGKFTLDGREYVLATSNSPGGIPCHLHGGLQGFHKKLWQGRVTRDGGVEFTYLSKDGEEGYPGNLTTKVTYVLNDENELIWKAEATTDAPTIVNLVQHGYWNLSGDPSTGVGDHKLMLAADHYLPTDAGQIPTGEIAPVAGTPMDFTLPTRIDARVGDDFGALGFAGGYDHAWVLREGSGLRLAARLEDPKTGRVMLLSTDQPAVQFYGGNFLDNTILGKGNVRYPKRSGLCLETENFPDAPNQDRFPSSVLRPGETYIHTMVHKFSAE